MQFGGRLIAWIRDFFKDYLNVRLALGFIAIIVLFLLFGNITEDVIERDRIVTLDYYVHDQIERIRNPVLTQAMTVVTNLGGVYVIGTGTVFIIFLLVTLRQTLWAHFFVWLMGGGAILDQILKMSIQRVRPPGLRLIAAHGWSYPSGHAMTSTLFYFALIYFILDKKYSWYLRLSISVFAFCLILLISFSRIYLGVHYMSDVLAGFIGGLIWLVICVITMEMRKRNKYSR